MSKPSRKHQDIEKLKDDIVYQAGVITALGTTLIGPVFVLQQFFSGQLASIGMANYAAIAAIVALQLIYLSRRKEHRPYQVAATSTTLAVGAVLLSQLNFGVLISAIFAIVPGTVLLTLAYSRNVGIVFGLSVMAVCWALLLLLPGLNASIPVEGFERFRPTGVLIIAVSVTIAARLTELFLRHLNQIMIDKDHQLNDQRLMLEKIARAFKQNSKELNELSRKVHFAQYQSEMLQKTNDLVRAVNNLEATAHSALEPKPEANKPFNPRVLLESVLHQYIDKLDQAGIRFNIATAPSLNSQFMGSADLIESILRTLVQNVCAHSKASALQLAATYDNDSEQLTFSVMDDGDGIPPEVEARLFEAFNTGPGSNPGLGLGLFLAHTRACQLGGQLSYQRLESGQQKHDAIFTLEVPSHKIASAITQQAANDPVRLARKLLGGNKVLLVATPSPETTQLRSEIAHALFCNVDLAESMGDAIEYSITSKPTLALIGDLGSDLSKGELTRILKTLTPESTIIVSLISADSDLKSEVVKLGADAVIDLPVSATALANSLAAISTAANEI